VEKLDAFAIKVADSIFRLRDNSFSKVIKIFVILFLNLVLHIAISLIQILFKDNVLTKEIFTEEEANIKRSKLTTMGG
jgi:cell division protein FtsL